MSVSFTNRSSLASGKAILPGQLDRAIKWLKENEYENEVLKWETRA